MVVDASALICLLLGEPEADACAARLADSDRLYLSAGNWAEALPVAARRGVRAELERLVSGLGIEIVPVTASTSVRVADAYERWGKGPTDNSLRETRTLDGGQIASAPGPTDRALPGGSATEGCRGAGRRRRH